jgi:hypothetical protein
MHSPLLYLLFCNTGFIRIMSLEKIQLCDAFSQNAEFDKKYYI